MLFGRLSQSLNSINKNIDFYNLQNNLRFYLNPLAKLQFNKEISNNLAILNNNINEYGYSKNLLSLNPLIHSYIIIWNEYSKTKLHGHSENGCFSYLIKGNLLEEVYKNDHLIKYNFMNESNNSKLSFIDNNIGQHIVSNLNDELSYSINIYSPSPTIKISELGLNSKDIEFYNKINNLQN